MGCYSKRLGLLRYPFTQWQVIKDGFEICTGKEQFRKYYILLCEPSKMAEFSSYLESEKMELVLWLDDEVSLAKLGKGE